MRASLDRPLSRSFVWWVSAWVVVGLVLRIAAVVFIPSEPIADFWSYLQRARNLVDHHVYGPFAGVSDASYPPAYPLLLAAGLSVGADELVMAKTINIGLGALLIGVAAAVGRALGGDRVGVATAAGVALYPRYVMIPNLLASENLFAPLLMLFALSVIRACDRDRAFVLSAAAGSVLGLMALTRAIGYGVFLLWPLCSLVARRRLRTIVIETLLILAAQHLVMAPWAVRNLVSLGELSFLTSVGGTNLFIGNNPGATGRWYDYRSDLQSVDSAVWDKGPFERDAVAFRAARDWISQHPAAAARLYLTKLGVMLGGEHYLLFYTVTGSGQRHPHPSTRVLPSEHFAVRGSAALLALFDAAYGVTLLLQMAGLGLLVAGALPGTNRESARPRICLMVGGPGYFVLAAAVFFGSTRFRWPASDLLMPAAGVVLALLWGWTRSSRSDADGDHELGPRGSRR